MRNALENFDQDLAWKMFTLACEYAQVLKYHQLDRPDGMMLFTTMGRPFMAQDRKGLWDLVQEDLRYRLILGKPPVFTANMDDWKVDLPDIATVADSHEDHTPAIQFLVSSRLTFALSDFFHILEQFESGDVSDLAARVEVICTQVNALYEEWNIVSSHQSDFLRKIP